MRVDFQAPEYHADQSFHETAYRFEGSLETGWSITRDARPHLELGPGYRLLRTQACGIWTRRARARRRTWRPNNLPGKN